MATVPVYNNQIPRGTAELRPVVEGNDLAAGVIEKLPADLDERLAALRYKSARARFRVFGNLKTWLRGTFHGVNPRHLQRCLDEFVFRFDRRWRETDLFLQVLHRALDAFAEGLQVAAAEEAPLRGQQHCAHARVLVTADGARADLRNLAEVVGFHSQGSVQLGVVVLVRDL